MKYNEHCFKVQTKLFFMTIKFFAPLYLFKPQQLCFHAVLDHRSFKKIHFVQSVYNFVKWSLILP